jgi:hypothetical protein
LLKAHISIRKSTEISHCSESSNLVGAKKLIKAFLLILMSYNTHDNHLPAH